MTSVVDSKHKKLSMQEIISIAGQETNSEFNANQIAAFIKTEVEKLNAKILRLGNTLFIIHADPQNPSLGVFRALNADTAKNYIENGKLFVKAASNMGFKILVATFTDPGLLNIFKAISKNPPLPNMGYAIQQSKSGRVYKVTINLGNGKKEGLPPGRMQEQKGGLSQMQEGF